jgi:peptide/nickel transport system substrate-binding protein
MSLNANGAERVAGVPQRARWIIPAAIVVCLATITGASGCHSADSPSGNAKLQIGVALPRSVEPSMGIRGFVNLLTRESLIGIGWDGRPTRKLVQDWGTLADGDGVWLRLDPKVKLHDGTQPTATAVAEILARDAARPQRPLSYASITAVQPRDDRTLEIRLSRPEAFLLSDLVETTIAGAGPYRLVEQKEGARLEAFPEYYRGKPQTDIIEVKPYTTQRNAWAAFMRGEINAVHDVSPAAIEFVEQETSVQTYPVLRGYYTYLAFNMRHPVLSRSEIRQALSQAIDRQKIVNLALRGRAEPADGPIWPFHWAYSTGQKTHSYNPDAARLRLDAAGFRLPTTREAGRMPSRLRFKCLIWTDDARFESIALVMQKQFFDIGVDMEIEAVPVLQFSERLQNGHFDTVLMEFTSGRSLVWVYAAFHSSHPILNSPLTGYRAADDLLDRLRLSSSAQETRESVGQLQRRFYEDPPGIFIAWPSVSRAVSTAFVVPQDTNPDVLSTIWQWRAQPQVTRR